MPPTTRITLVIPAEAEGLTMQFASALASAYHCEIPFHAAPVEAAVPPPAPVSGRVVYRTTPAGQGLALGGVRGLIIAALCQHGMQSAHALEALTGKGRKSIEGAVHALRTMGAIESAPVAS